MKLIIVRHADPDYSIDGLTAKGRREAILLTPYVQGLRPDYAYVSPLGRAQNTAEIALKAYTLKAPLKTCDWLREFPGQCKRPHTDNQAITWDWMPGDWTAEPRFFLADQWYDVPVMQVHHVKEIALNVYDNLDRLLENHGYRRHLNTPENPGQYYDAVRPNHDTLVFFCHFGIESVLLAHLMNVSPMILWHSTIARPSAVTVLVTEERQEGKAYFRMLQYGSISHLEQANEPASPSGRFREVFSDDEFYTATFD